MYELLSNPLTPLSAAAAGLACAVRAPWCNWLAPSVHKGVPYRKSLALTFDDGPSESTKDVLDLLDRYGVRATFFMCGANVRRLPDVAQEVFCRGHEIGIQVHYQPPPRPLQVPEQSAIHIYRILQESLNNVARHANVNEVQVAIEVENGNFTLRIEDAGPGFSKPLRTGIGLAAMRERAALIGASLDIGPGAASKGTRVKLRAPLQTTEEPSLAR